VHQLEKLVDGAPLRRPWWFFDVRVQGSGAVDIPTHLVDRTQWLVDGAGVPPGAPPRLVSARVWPTRVPGEAFRRITGESEFPPDLRPVVDGDALSYLSNADLVWQIGGVTAHATTRWELTPPATGGDAARIAVHGTLGDVVLEQGPRTGHRRRLVVALSKGASGVERALGDAVAAWQAELPGLGVGAAGAGQYEVTIPSGLDAGHESHFTRVLDDFLTLIDTRRWPATLVARTLAKYTFLAEVAAKTGDAHARPGSKESP